MSQRNVLFPLDNRHFITDLTGSELTHQELINTIIQRLPRRLKNSTDIIVKDEDSLLIVLRYIKKR